jgi:murein L,D-transpeptidase YcbB/YkuD
MRASGEYFGLIGVSLLALVAASNAGAQDAPDVKRPAIVLPPLPDINASEAPVTTEVAPVISVLAAPVQAAPVFVANTTADIRAALAARAELSRAEAPVRGALAPATRQRVAIAATYAARDFTPMWLADGHWTPAATAALARLENAADDGLDLRATPLPKDPGDTAAALAEADFALSAAIVNFAWQASGGRVDPKSVSRLISETPVIADPATVLAHVSTATDADATLRDYNPPQPGYKALRDKLVELRKDRPKTPEVVPAGATVKIGMKDVRAPMLRARFGLEAPEGADDTIYDAKLAAAIAEFQRANGMAPSGILAPRVVAALNAGDPVALEDEIIANMERWRWEPRSQTDNQIEVNIPDYTVKVTFGGVVAHRARVVVGKPDTPTPVFSNRMQFIEVNPYWNVPDSIIKKEMMPKLAQDPSYLQRMGYEVTYSSSGKMIVRQPPGERNALGRIKFMFPNEHAVYLHDTPSRGLFATARRAFSHGCVRVDDPFRFAEVVLGKESGWNEARVKRLIGGKNQTIPLPKHIDIHIEYFTAFVDDAGKLQTREDVYGYSRKVRAALGLGGAVASTVAGSRRAI